jgi:hypothetical protein
LEELSEGNVPDIQRRRRQMPHAFSKTQLVFRLLFLLVDIVGNMSILSAHQTLTLGTLHLEYVPFIIVFNAAVIMIIYIVDLIIVAVLRVRTNYAVGQGLTDLHRHEQ